MKYLLLFLILFTTLLSANDKMDTYASENWRTIIDSQQDLSKETITISLSDGTVWVCYLGIFYDKKNDDPELKNSVLIRSLEKATPGCCNLFIITDNRNIGYRAILDPSTIGALPTVTDLSDGMITLSDGSVWQEKASLYYSSSYWNVGDRVLVTFDEGYCYIINLFRESDYSTHIAKAVLLDWVRLI